MTRTPSGSRRPTGSANFSPVDAFQVIQFARSTARRARSANVSDLTGGRQGSPHSGLTAETVRSSALSAGPILSPQTSCGAEPECPARQVDAPDPLVEPVPLEEAGPTREDRATEVRQGELGPAHGC